MTTPQLEFTMTEHFFESNLQTQLPYNPSTRTLHTFIIKKEKKYPFSIANCQFICIFATALA